jgi:hypothetical protein
MKMLSFFVVPIYPLGQVNVKFDRNSLFSERYGKVPTFSLLGIRFTWRRWARS